MTKQKPSIARPRSLIPDPCFLPYPHPPPGKVPKIRGTVRLGWNRKSLGIINISEMTERGYIVLMVNKNP